MSSPGGALAPQPQDKVSAALSLARSPRAPSKAKAPKAPQVSTLHTGPIHSPVAGRTDHLPMHVPNGSYVIPADIVSALGEGNTVAGFRHLRQVFPAKAKGGDASGVPIVAAGGEYVITPEAAAAAGDGDLDLGHQVLDEFVRRVRSQTVDTLQKLPGPKVD